MTDKAISEFSISKSGDGRVQVVILMPDTGFEGPGSHLTGQAAALAFVSFVLTHAWAILTDKSEQWAVDKVAVDTLQRVVMTHASTFISKVFGVQVGAKP